MTVYYMDSSAGSATSPYNSWATAATAISQIMALLAAGDTIYAASTHAESGAATDTITFPGTFASPNLLICADKTSGAPPTTAATGASITTTSAGSILLSGCAYIYGVSFNVGSGNNSVALTFGNVGTANNCLVLDNCAAAIVATGGNHINSGPPVSGSNKACYIEWRNSTFKVAQSTQTYQCRYGETHMYGCSLLGTVAPTSLFNFSGGSGGRLNASSCDWSGLAFTNLVDQSASGNWLATFSYCKLPSSISVSTQNPAGVGGVTVQMLCCDSGTAEYRSEIDACLGVQSTDSAIFLSGGATDGTTPISWKMASNANAEYLPQVFRSEWRSVWVDTTVSKTLTWQYVADTNVVSGQGAGTAFAFQNNQVWIEALYLGSSTSPLGTLASSSPATPLTAATDNAAGSGTWTTTGLTTPKQGECTLTFTTAMKGPMLARICVGAASKTIYADPAPTFA